MPRPPNAHRPLAIDLLALPEAQLRPMFGGESIYVGGILLLVLADGEAPWNGLLFPVEREHHPSIRAEFPYLIPHEVLPKWLFLCEDDDRFEFRANSVLACLLARDARFGVLPKPRKRRLRAAGTDSPKAGLNEPRASDGRPPHLR